MTAENAAERLAAALTARGCQVRRNTAQCPAHEDRTPSLSFRQIEGQVLVHCHAGCATADVVAALGLSMRDLFDEPREGVRYSYTDVTGTATRVVHRTPDKRFRQSGDTSTPQLYRLPRVVEAVAAGTTVYVVEGEKDVHALEAVGAVTTTSPMGASNWPKVDTSPLKGAHVVVVPDQDDVGRRYALDVLASLDGVAASVTVARPKVGKDAADHVAAGYGLNELIPVDAPPATGHRTLTLTSASSIKPRPVRWAWEGRIALGTLALDAGREGIGKSLLGCWMAAHVTRGTLPGAYYGTPRAVIIAATEDSWEHTLVPRLMAAGADLDLVFRVDVTTAEGVGTGPSLPRDLVALERAVRESGTALIILDPLMSRLDAQLDTHKDAEVRLALEPLVALADRTGAAILGLIHVNKSSSTDPLNVVMASRAFTAVARSVLFVMLDPDDETTRLVGQPKNNLGSTDLPTLAFQVDSTHVADTDEGPVWTGRLTWRGERTESIRDVLEASGESADARSATSEAAGWLEDHLTSKGGTDDSASIKEAGRRAGHSKDALIRALNRLKGTSEARGFPRRTYWSLPGTQPQSSQPSGRSPGESATTATTATTGDNGRSVVAVNAVDAVVASLPRTRDDCVPEDEEPDIFELIRHGGEPASMCLGCGELVADTDMASGDTCRRCAAECPSCGWPLDSHGHKANCERGAA